jgi:hypothetical protein
VIASIYTGEIAPETARYASMDQAGQVLRDLVQQGRLEEGSWEIRPAPTDGDVAPAFTPDDF